MKYFTIVYIGILQIMFTPIYGQWATDPNINNEICTFTYGQGDQSVASDGFGGAIITWVDNRNGNSDIYAQRISHDGYIQWALDGVPICTELGDQYYPQIIADGNGGAIIVWQDRRSSIYDDIYAQKVNSIGVVQWNLNGNSICTSANNQISPVLSSDNLGGALFAWRDLRDGISYDIYSQRLNGTGVSQWFTNGIQICSTPENQTEPVINSDSFGNAIIVWTDDRNGNGDIFAQRISYNGSITWLPNGVPICTSANEQVYPVIVSDMNNGAIISWQHNNGANWNINAQRIDSIGVTQWTTNGVIVSNAFYDQKWPQLTSDGLNGAIIAWSDNRQDGSANYSIYSQRVRSNGSMAWASNGIPICHYANNPQNFCITYNGSSGAYIGWEDFRNSQWDIYAQLVDSAGNRIWIANGVGIAISQLGNGNQNAPDIISDEAGGAILAWTDARNQAITALDVYAQRIDTSGNLCSNLIVSYDEPQNINCISYPSFELADGIPMGGTYSGSGVLDSIFTPSNAGIGSYYINYTYTDAYGCISNDSSLIQIIDCLGLENNDEEIDIIVYPNPCKDLVNINSINNPILKIEIFNTFGQLVRTSLQSTSQLDLSGINSGYYLLHIYTESKTISKRLVIY